LCGRPRAALEARDRSESHLRSLASAPTDLHATLGLIGAALLARRGGGQARHRQRPVLQGRAARWRERPRAHAQRGQHVAR
jgi:hypothetical protein